MEKIVRMLSFLALLASCRPDNPQPVGSADPAPAPVSQTMDSLRARGYQVFDYVDPETGDTLVMQQYFMVFLKRGPNRSQSPGEADSLQGLHLAHLARMYREGFADISGPFGDEGEIRGITIYNTTTLEMADSLANLDPMVQAGRLAIEVHPWWAAKGYSLR
ncbi:YciI family protein [Robiginitalea marina]|uniref:Phenylalanyl-tRNA synthetase subunit alpha n=1 Tax=Robiginitalea marina TaxID=2954105 RepID=A0ABT1AWN9_9FLAO|nr:hypothetical protein [Robiginitalea marina]MCO5724416.1 hypothetical protein [Robiginitalea marina]